MIHPATHQQRLGRYWSNWSDLTLPLSVMFGGAALTGVVTGLAGWSSSIYWALGLLCVLAGLSIYLVRLTRAAPRLQRGKQAPTSGETTIALGVAMGSAKEEKLETAGLHPQRVLALGGPTAVGKSLIADELKKAHPNWAYASCGKFVVSQAKKQGKGKDLLATHEFGAELVETLGAERFLEQVLEHADGPPDADTLIVDDIYHDEVLQALENRWDHLYFAGFKVREPVHVAMLHGRGLDDSGVQAIEKSPLEQQGEALIAKYKPDLYDGAATEAEARERSKELSAALAEAA
jgi:hypothetical protein